MVYDTRQQMQKFLYTTLFLCLYTLAAISQNTLQSVKAPNKIDANGLRQGRWLVPNDKYEQQKQNKAHATYYRLMTFLDSKPVGKMVDFYKSGQAKMVIDSIIDWGQQKFHGKIMFYHPDGKKERVHEYKMGQLITTVYYNLDGTQASPS